MLRNSYQKSHNYIMDNHVSKSEKKRRAKNIEKLRSLFKKNVKFVEFDENKEKFIENLCKPYKISNISIEGDGDSDLVKVEVNPRDKSKLIGKGGRNINMIRKLAQRHHPIKDVQIK